MSNYARPVNVATTFTGFYQRYGLDPHFAFYDGVPGVSRMSPHPTWTTGVNLVLANAGDEVLLLGPGDQLIDGVTWGTGALPGHAACAAFAPELYASLERRPIDRDSDSCPADFVADPGALP